jgi:hypothetical protein
MELDSLTAARMGYRVKGRRAQPKICGETFGVMEVEYRYLDLTLLVFGCIFVATLSLYLTHCTMYCSNGWRE